MKPNPRVFLLDDEDLVVSMLGRALRKEGYEVLGETDPEGAVAKIQAFAPDVVLLDIRLPGKDGIGILQELVSLGTGAQVVMLTSDDTAETAVRAMKLGAADYLTKPFDLEKVKIVLRGLVEKRELRHEVEYLRKVSSGITRREIVGTSGAITKLKSKCEKLALSSVPTLLITGESGTGKELVARYIHSMMHPAESGEFAPFLGVNCSALPESLIESELFGHEKGAYTDAKAETKGIFELGSGGSVLLDEIAEMKPSLQAKLLRVLEERTVRRLGGRQDIPVDATVFATTNRDLPSAVEKGEFRADLYYRLTAFSLHVPPLRERKEDVPLLARYFLSHYARRYKKMPVKEISPEAERLLAGYGWPGNVRELRNVMEHIVVLEAERTVLPGHLPADILRGAPAGIRKEGAGITLPETGFSLEEAEKSLIVQALERAGGNKTMAAKLLGISYDSLRYQVRKFGLE
jgi:DNA-binding NtrC family response regulator